MRVARVRVAREPREHGRNDAVTGTDTRGPAPSTPTRGERALDWALGRGPLSTFLIVIAASIVKYGIGIFPAIGQMQAIAQNWTNPTASYLLQPPYSSFRLNSSTSALLAGILHLTSGPRFLGFHFVLACGAIGTPFLMPAVRRSRELRLCVALLLVGGAVPAVLLGWVGSYDPVTVAAASVAGLTRSRAVAALAWAVFAFNNAPEAAIALCVYAAVLFVHDRRGTWQMTVASVAGGIAGYAGIRLLTSSWGGSSSRFSVFQEYPFSRFASDTVHYWPLIILSALGVGWLFLTRRGVWRHPAAKALFVLALLVSVVVPLIALDPTRIASGALWPSELFVAAATIGRTSVRTTRRVLLRTAPFALVLVLMVVWDSNLVYAGWDAIGTFLRTLFGQLPLPVPGI